MSAGEKIAKLEGLLARVRERAESGEVTRAGSGAYPVPSRTVVPPSEIAEALLGEDAATMPTELPEQSEAVPQIHVPPAPPVAVSMPPLPATSGWSDPPPPTSAEPPQVAEAFTETTAPPAPDDSDVDVEVSTEVVEIDIDEPGFAAADRGFAPAESGAQLVAEQVSDEPLHEDLAEALVATTTSIPPELVESIPPDLVEPQTPAGNEVLEPEPSSSPRPIEDAYAAADRAYEEESAPRHTPPPESGKQVAAASVRPEALRKSSVPPDSLGGNTLVDMSAPAAPTGAWREPGLSAPSSRGSRVPPSAAPPTVNLSPEVTRPAVAIEANVVRIDGTSPSFAPATFGELLDATLAL